jgi:hypothetical protein
MKKPILALFCCVMLLARINPFEPSEPPNERDDTTSALPRQLGEEKIDLPVGARVIKEIKIVHQENDGSIGSVDRKINKTIDWRAPLRFDQPDAVELPRRAGVFAPISGLEDVDRIQFFAAGDVLKLQTKDDLIRNFFLPRPSRIAMDFNSSVPLEPAIAKLSDGYFTQIELSFHDTFYRVVITLESYYPYAIERVSEGYLLGLN